VPTLLQRGEGGFGLVQYGAKTDIRVLSTCLTLRADPGLSGNSRSTTAKIRSLKVVRHLTSPRCGRETERGWHVVCCHARRRIPVDDESAAHLTAHHRR